MAMVKFLGKKINVELQVSTDTEPSCMYFINFYKNPCQSTVLLHLYTRLQLFYDTHNYYYQSLNVQGKSRNRT